MAKNEFTKACLNEADNLERVNNEVRDLLTTARSLEARGIISSKQYWNLKKATDDVRSEIAKHQLIDVTAAGISEVAGKAFSAVSNFFSRKK